MSEPYRWRCLWRDCPRSATYEFWWDVIRHDSYVVITTAEAVVSDIVPDKFVGDARTMVVGNISPHDGYVEFVPWWNIPYLYLTFWTDILIFNPQ